MKTKKRKSKKTSGRKSVKKAVKTKKKAPAKVKKTKRAVRKKPPTKKTSKASKAATQATKPKTLPIQGTLIGKVTHYFPHVNAAVIKIEVGELRRGDQIYIKGHTSDFKQKIVSMQINHQRIEKAMVGDEIGIEVKERVREHDAVYKL